MRENFVYDQKKLIFTFIISFLIILSSFVFIDLFYFSKNLKNTISDNMITTLEKKEDFLGEIFQSAESIIHSIHNSNIFKNYIKQTHKDNNVKDFFKALTLNNQNIMQLRYIDKDGIEKIRIDRKALNSDIIILPNELLQDKSSRYYFTNLRDNAIKGIWYSNLDLNIENEKIQMPYNPTLRAGIRLEKNDGTFNGILIVNFFMENILKKLINNPFYDMVLLDENGYPKVHHNPNLNWAKFKDNKYNLSKDFPESILNILSKPIFNNDEFISKKLELETSEKLILLIKVNKTHLLNEQDRRIKEYLLECGILILILIFVSWIFSKLIRKLLVKLEDTKKYNEKLNYAVTKKTRKLRLLNKSLEDAESLAELGNWNYDINTKRLLGSKNLYNLFGVDRNHDLKLMDVFQKIIHESDSRKVLSPTLKPLDKSFNFKIFRSDNNKERHLECNFEYIYQEKKLISIVGTIQDISDLLELTNELDILKQTIEQAPISIVITDDKSNIEYINPNFTKVTSYELKDVLGKNPNIVKSDHTNKSEYEILWQTVSSGKVWTGTFKNIDKNGNHFWEKAIISPILDKDKKRILKYIAIKQEITKEVYLKNELIKKDELIALQSRSAAMNEIISMIAHQWRQPLAVISMVANNMQVDIELNEFKLESVKYYLNDIVKQTTYLSRTIENFGSFFKPKKQKELTKTSDIVNRALKLLRNTFEEHNVQIHEDYDDDITYKSFSNELLQVFISIFKNAYEIFISNNIESPTININQRIVDNFIYIEVIDNAGGIDSDNISKIFDPYFSTKNNLVGRGLGLYMSKAIIEEHLNGKISAYNKLEGAAFLIEIPKG